MTSFRPARRPDVRIGEIPVRPVISDWWTLGSFPEWVVVRGRLFQRASWAYPYDGVVAQYREHATRNAMHLMVFRDGHFEIDHIDEDNPDRGRVVEHFFNDVPIGKFIRDAAPFVAAIAVGYLGGKALAKLAA